LGALGMEHPARRPVVPGKDPDMSSSRIERVAGASPLP